MLTPGTCVEKPLQEAIAKEREESSVTDASPRGHRPSEGPDAAGAAVTVSDDNSNCVDAAF